MNQPGQNATERQCKEQFRIKHQQRILSHELEDRGHRGKQNQRPIADCQQHIFDKGKKAILFIDRAQAAPQVIGSPEEQQYHKYAV